MKNQNKAIKNVMLTIIAVGFSLPVAAAADTVTFNVKDTTGADKFAVTDSGRVLIGGASTSAAINIKGGGPASAQIMSRYVATNASGGGGVVVFHNNDNGAFPVTGNRLGYYLFGSYNESTSAGMNTAGMIAYAENSWSVSPTYYLPTYLTFATTETDTRLERVRITAAGKVGIGTTAPTQQLEVNGGVRLNTASTKPTCDANSAGTLWYENGAADDNLWVCAKKSGIYAWKQLW
jgi:hypothetical protein